MRRWPQSLRTHGYKGWWLGSIGNVFLWWVVQPVAYVLEKTARVIRREPSLGKLER
jgi:hypothetical protein